MANFSAGDAVTKSLQDPVSGGDSHVPAEVLTEEMPNQDRKACSKALPSSAGVWLKGYDIKDARLRSENDKPSEDGLAAHI